MQTPKPRRKPAPVRWLIDWWRGYTDADVASVQLKYVQSALSTEPLKLTPAETRARLDERFTAERLFPQEPTMAKPKPKPPMPGKPRPGC